MMKVYAEPVAKEKKQIERNRTIGDRASAFARILIRTLHVAPCLKRCSSQIRGTRNAYSRRTDS